MYKPSQSPVCPCYRQQRLSNSTNGVFAKYLMEHMIEPYLPIEQVLKRVRIAVARQTNGRQIPW